MMSDQQWVDEEEQQEFLPVLSQDNTPAIIACGFPMGPTATREEKEFLHWVLTSPCPNLKEAMPKPGEQAQRVNIVNMLAHPVEFAPDPQTGEVKSAKRVVFLLDDGNILSSTSTGIYRSVQQIFSIYGPPPWDPPVSVIPVDIETRNNRRYRILTVPKPKLPQMGKRVK